MQLPFLKGYPMNNVNKTLYIPLYGKAYVSKKNIILQDKKAEELWEQADIQLKGKSKSKWLAYYMAMRAATFDMWVRRELEHTPDAVVLHIGCGLDSRIERVDAKSTLWYDIDFPEVIRERKKYFTESEHYHMLATDMRGEEWKEQIPGGIDAIVFMEGVSMYFEPEELSGLLSGIGAHFKSVKLLMDCYSTRAAKASKYKNPINDVGVTAVYGYDEPQKLAEQSGLTFVEEKNMTPENFVDELQGMERYIFRHLFAGKIAKAMYRSYCLQSTQTLAGGVRKNMIQV